MLSNDFWENMNDETDEGSTMEMLEMAYHNSYKIATNKCTFEDLMESNDDLNIKYTVVMHDIDNGPSNDDIENMIEWFIEYEEYEKCAELKNILDNQND